MKRFPILFLLLCFAAAGMELPETVKPGDGGSFRIGDAEFRLQLFTTDRREYSQQALSPAPGFPRRDDGAYRQEGRFPGGFNLSESLTALKSNAFRAEYALTAEKGPVPVKQLCLTVDLPAVPGRLIRLDDREIRIPETAENADLIYGQFRQLVFELPEQRLRVTGHYRVSVRDNRKSGDGTISLRLMPITSKNPVEQWKISAVIEIFQPFFSKPLQEGVSTDDAGNIRIGDAILQYVHYAPGWRPVYLTAGNLEADADSPRLSADGTFHYSGKWSGFRYSSFIAAEKENAIRVRTILEAAPPVTTEAVALIYNIPADDPGEIRMDGNIIPLPETFNETRIVDWQKARTFQFESGGRVISLEGDFKLMIVDDRKWNKNFFVVRLSPEPFTGTIRRTEWDFTVRVTGPRTRPLDLSGLFTDGRKSEFAKLNAGEFLTAGARFKIAGGAKSCLVLSGENKTASLKLAGPEGFLYLLHAAEFAGKQGETNGRIVAEYADGSSRTFPVPAGDYRRPVSVTNKAVVWTAETGTSYAGFYLSQFPVGNAVQLRFENDPGCKWMILAASTGNEELKLDRIRTPFYRVAGEDWTELTFTGKVKPGSPLDFSCFTDAPAGKYGPVIVNGDGHFSFRDAPERRIRFFGPNLVGSANFLERKLADDFAEKAARLGYNSIRFHHFENGLLAADSPDSLTFDPKRLDQFDYLFAELKKRGIYACLDLFASRKLRPGDNIAEYQGKAPGTFFETKGLIPVSPGAMANWKEFTRRLLTHRNPYTGLRYADDPALYGVNLVNEGPLSAVWNRSPILVGIYEAKYFEYLKRNGLDTPANRKERSGIFTEFLHDTQIRSIREQVEFLRREIKTNVLATDMNTVSKYLLIPPRSALEYVDIHFYWNHPRFVRESWRLPFLFSNRSLVGERAGNLRAIMPTRVFGKPFTVTEFNLCTPDPFRTECGPVLGGYAALQDWDGLHRFAWSHSDSAIRNMTVPTGFDIVNDPQAQLAERIIGMLFVRGDVQPAKSAFAFCCTPEDLRKERNNGDFPEEFTLLGLYGRIGSLPSGASLPGVLALNPLDGNWRTKLPAAIRARTPFTSETGEIRMDAAEKEISVITPRSEVFAFRQSASGKVAAFRGDNENRCAALLSLDGAELGKSRKMLLLHLVDVAGSRQKFADSQCFQLESWGTLPLLLKRSKMEVTLKLPGVKVEALRMDGTVSGVVKTEYRDGVLRFQTDTAGVTGGVMAYLLTK